MSTPCTAQSNRAPTNPSPNAVSRPHNNNPGHPLVRGMMYVYHRDPTQQDSVTSTEDIHWKVYGIKAPSQAVPLVLLWTADKTWDLGTEHILGEVASLLNIHRTNLGPPTTDSSDVLSLEQHAAWVLCLPDGNYSFVMVTPKTSAYTADCVSFHPVFAIAPHVRAGSAEALELIFPGVATAALEDMMTNPRPTR
jgi:hypothetical protein